MGKRTFVVLSIAAAVMGASFPFDLPVLAAAAGSTSTVAQYVFSVGPTIAPENTLDLGDVQPVAFTVTAEDSQRDPVPDAVIYLSFTTTSTYPGLHHAQPDRRRRLRSRQPRRDLWALAY